MRDIIWENGFVILHVRVREKGAMCWCVRRRTADIAVTALQQFMVNAFIEDTREAIEINDALFVSEEITNDVIRPVKKKLP